MLRQISFWILTILIGFSLVIIFTSCTSYSTSSALPAQNTTNSQPANTTSSASPALTQASPISPTTGSVTVPTNISNGPNLVSLPSFADLLSATENSVVEINTIGSTTSSFGRIVQLQGAGSGWIIDPNGVIVTNDHVIEGATSITVITLDGKNYTAQVLNSDPVTDLALLKINATKLKNLNIGDASKLRPGDWVIAIGNPLGEGIIATQGIVSRLGVSLPVSSTQTYNDLIETTAAINPGNSGGPLLNLAGEVIGITSVKVSASGIEGMGYALNMVDALPVIQKLGAP